MRIILDFPGNLRIIHIKVVLTPKTKRISAEVWYSRQHSVPLYQNPKEFYINAEQAAIISPIKEKLQDKIKRPTLPPIE
jgi:hypothetical protein